jgi:hypothetical protein
MSTCDAWIQFVMPADVKALKMRLNSYFLALDAGITQCPKVDQATRDAWDGFSTGWRNYYAKEEHFWTAGSELRTGCEYEAAIASWQRTIGAYASCNVAGPMLPDRAAGDDGGADGGGDTSTKKTVRTVAIAAGVVAAALALRGVTR